MFVENNGTDVGCVDNHVDDDKIGIRVIARNLTKRITKGKAGHHDRVGARFGETAQRLFTLCFGLQFDLAEAFTGLFGPALRASKGGFVEGFIEFAAKVEDQGGFGQSRTGTKSRGRSSAEEFGHKGHGVSPGLLCWGASAKPLPGRSSALAPGSVDQMYDTA